MKRICHITTVHSRYDVRIFHKECKSLSKKYEVFLIVADGLGTEIKDNVSIIDIGLRQKSKIKRSYIDSKNAFKKAIELNCELYHFHDPELMFVGKKLKKYGKIVIYDVHEDIPKQIGIRVPGPKFIKNTFSFLIKIIEHYNSKFFNAIITSTPYIENRIKNINKNVLSIKNYPIINEFSIPEWENKNNSICYIGAITENRGIIAILDSLSFHNFKLILAGKFENPEIEVICRNHKNWKKVDFRGFVDRAGISDILSKSKIGLVTLLPIQNYLDSLPIKMFEYMAAGIPVVASDFPLWKDIIIENKCGICVNPLKSEEISIAVKNLIENDNSSKKMGESGRISVKKKFNWELEEQKLFNLYNKIN